MPQGSKEGEMSCSSGRTAVRSGCEPLGLVLSPHFDLAGHLAPTTAALSSQPTASGSIGDVERLVLVNHLRDLVKSSFAKRTSVLPLGPLGSRATLDLRNQADHASAAFRSISHTWRLPRSSLLRPPAAISSLSFLWVLRADVSGWETFRTRSRQRGVDTVAASFPPRTSQHAC
eukprot:scaffold7832_cov267-Pinguiococcus_pyrenoidosus.AAC.8